MAVETRSNFGERTVTTIRPSEPALSCAKISSTGEERREFLGR